MISLQETITVARDIDEAFAYLSDFATTAEWDPGVLAARKLTPGPIAEGTAFEVVCALPVGSVTLEYTVRKLQPRRKIELEGSCAFFEVRDTILFTANARGTKIDYRADFTFRPGVDRVAQWSRAGLERMGRSSVEGLRRALEDNFTLPAPAAAGRAAPGHVLKELANFSRLGFRRSKWRLQPISASVRGRHMVISGASSGLGYSAARELARRGAALTLVFRDRGKAREVVDALRTESGNEDIRSEIADLSLMADIDKLIGRLRKQGRPIDVLVNNAGALFDTREETSEGLERSFALLLLGPVRLTEGLRPLLAKADAPRVINVVSGGMYTQALCVDTLLAEDEGNWSGSIAYARQKRALMVMTEEWAREWADDGIVVNAMHPGWADTPGVRSALPGFYKVTRAILRTPEEGADTIVWLAAATEAGNVSGQLFLDRKQRPTHLIKRTVEPSGEREKLVAFLKGF